MRWYWSTTRRPLACTLARDSRLRLSSGRINGGKDGGTTVREIMAMKNVAITVCAMLLLVPASWGTENPPKKFPTGSSHPHRSLAQTQATGHARSSGSSASLSKSQSGRERERELERIEHQNTVHPQAQSRQRSAKAGGQAARIHPEPTGHGSGINYSYHPPRTQSTGSGSRKH